MVAVVSTSRSSTTRFRCGHCGNRLVMHDRHLRRLVVCHACGRGTHPVARHVLAGVARPKPQPRPVAALPAAPVPAPVSPKPPTEPKVVPVAPAPRLDLSLTPLIPLVFTGAAGAAFFAAMSVMTYLSGFVTALVLIAALAVALRWVRRSAASARARLRQIDDLRRRHGTLRVAGMLLSWLWKQPGGEKVWGLGLVALWGGLYLPYCLSGLLLPAPKRSVVMMPARVVRRRV